MAPRHPFSTLAYVRAAGAGDQLFDVPAWNATVLGRKIPGTNWVDAAGCYPFLPFGTDVDIAAGLVQLRDHGFVSVVLVTDPLHQPSREALSAFNICRPYKTHYIFDRSLGPIDRTRRRWREVYMARRSLRMTEVDFSHYFDEFARLYGNLIEHHEITGAAAFDKNFFATLRGIGGIRAIGAWVDAELVSMMLFVVFEGTVYSFLAGTTIEGRARCAHYGLYAEALEGFTEASVINFGGAPGLLDDPTHGIIHVKRKLTNTTRTSQLCGAILQPDIYAELSAMNSLSDEHAEGSFFPSYRNPQKIGIKEYS